MRTLLGQDWRYRYQLGLIIENFGFACLLFGGEFVIIIGFLEFVWGTNPVFAFLYPIAAWALRIGMIIFNVMNLYGQWRSFMDERERFTFRRQGIIQIYYAVLALCTMGWVLTITLPQSLSFLFWYGFIIFLALVEIRGTSDQIQARQC